MVLSDLAYRFKAGLVTTVPVPFLGYGLCKVRAYVCLGVHVCCHTTEEFRTKCHGTVGYQETKVLENVRIQTARDIINLRVHNTALEIRVRINNQFFSTSLSIEIETA